MSLSLHVSFDAAQIFRKLVIKLNYPLHVSFDAVKGLLSKNEFVFACVI